MELRDSLAVFVRRKTLGIAIIAIVVGGSYLWSYTRPTQYTTSMSFAINRVNKEQTTQYQYDGYYALQAADLFSQTVVSWLNTPSILERIYARAGATMPRTLSGLSSVFKTKKYSAQNIVVTFNTPTSEEAEKLAAAASDEIASRTSSVNRNADDKAIFEVITSKPVTELASPDPLLIGIMSFVVAVTLAMFLVPFVDYLAGPRQP